MNRPIYVCTEHLTLTLSRQREVRKWRIPTLAHRSRPVGYHIDGPSEWSGSLTAPTILYLMHLTFSTETSWDNVVGKLWLVPWTITEVRQHFLIRTILNTHSITTNTIISSRIMSNHRYNRNQARIPSPQQKDSRSVNTLLISHLVQFRYTHKESKLSKAHRNRATAMQILSPSNNKRTNTGLTKPVRSKLQSHAQ